MCCQRSSYLEGEGFFGGAWTNCQEPSNNQILFMVFTVDRVSVFFTLSTTVSEPFTAVTDAQAEKRQRKSESCAACRKYKEER